MESKQKDNNFVKKISPRFYGFICTLLGVGLGFITIRYIQDNGFFDLSEGWTISGLLGGPILVVATFAFVFSGPYYLIKGKWIEE